MKTLKFAMIAALIACTMVSLANADGFKEKPKFSKVVNLTLEAATHNPGLVRAIYLQVDRDDVLIAHVHIFVTDVYYQGNAYRISGTFDQWMHFFNRDGAPLVNTKHQGLHLE
jgi:hypothetical protein